MANEKISLSGQELSFSEISHYYITSEKSLRSIYQKEIINSIDYTIREILNNELEQYIEELDKSTALTMLAAIEAHFIVDFLQRCYYKDKKPISREFQKIFKRRKKNSKVYLEDILEIWKQYTKKTVISDLIGAFKYRNWLAHGRYWVYKAGHKYDVYSLFTLSIDVQNELGIEIW
jgi:hypothetical protein